MIEDFIPPFMILFAALGPVTMAVVFLGLVAPFSYKRRRETAVKSVLFSFGILSGFAFLGEFVLTSLGISIHALRTAGGFLLFSLGMEKVFSKDTTAPLGEDDYPSADIALCPLAVPLIAGPGAITAIILLSASAEGNTLQQSMVALALAANHLLMLFCFLMISRSQQFLGKNGIGAINSLVGVLLLALGVQFVFDGVKQAGIFS